MIYTQQGEPVRFPVRVGKYETYQMAEWRTYSDAGYPPEMVAEMKDPGNRKVAERHHRQPTAAERRETEARWHAISALTEREMREHCQFDGMGPLAR